MKPVDGPSTPRAKNKARLPGTAFYGGSKPKLVDTWSVGLFKELPHGSSKGVMTNRDEVLRRAANLLLENVHAGRYGNALQPYYGGVKKKHILKFVAARNAASVLADLFQKKMSRQLTPSEEQRMSDARAHLGDIQRKFPQAIKALRPEQRKILQLNRLHGHHDSVSKRVSPLGTSAPKLRVAKHHVTDWTSYIFEDVQNKHRRGHDTWYHEKTDKANRLRAMQVNRALMTYMLQHSPRAPHIPPGMFVGGQRPVLYRGIHREGTNVDKILRDKTYAEKGYIAFTRSRHVGQGYGSGGLLMVLDPYSVPRGTPWIWYSDTIDAPLPNRSVHRSKVHHEEEVLLPPGELRIVGTPVHMGKYIEARIAYIPDPAYVPKPRRRGPNGPDWNMPSLF